MLLRKFTKSFKTAFQKLVKNNFFKANNLYLSMRPLTYSLKLFGMYHYNMKNEPLLFLRSLIILLAYIVASIRFFWATSYKKIYEGYAIEILSPLFEISCGFICVMSYYVGILRNSKFFSTWYTNIGKIDQMFVVLGYDLNYQKTFKMVFAYVIISVSSAFLILYMSHATSVYGVRIQLLLAFIYPFLNQNLYMTGFICSLHILQERGFKVNLIIHNNRYKINTSTYKSIQVSLEIHDKLCDMMLLLVKVNGPLDLCTRLLNLVVLVCSVYSIPFAIANFSYSGHFAFNLIFGVALNQIFTILLLRIAQKCVFEVSNNNNNKTVERTHIFV